MGYTCGGLDSISNLSADLPDGQDDPVTACRYGISRAAGGAGGSTGLLAAIQHPDRTTGRPGSSQQKTVAASLAGASGRQGMPDQAVSVGCHRACRKAT